MAVTSSEINLPVTFPDVAAAAAFLASDDARCITGHTLLVDSGAAAGTETLKTN